MSEFEGHTPGPWRIIGRSGETMEVAIGATLEGGEYCAAVAIPCGNGRSGIDRAPTLTEANARLIAAAPTLLAERDSARAEAERLKSRIAELEARHGR